MEQVRVTRCNRFRYQREAGLGAIDQPAKLRGRAHRLACNPVTTVKKPLITSGLLREPGADLGFIPIDRTIVLDHEGVHRRVGVAHAIGEYDDATCLA